MASIKQNMWQTFQDKTTGRDYYYNATTKATTWYKPPELAATTTIISPPTHSQRAIQHSATTMTTRTSPSNINQASTTPLPMPSSGVVQYRPSGSIEPVENVLAQFGQRLPSQGTFSTAHLNPFAYRQPSDLTGQLAERRLKLSQRRTSPRSPRAR